MALVEDIAEKKRALDAARPLPQKAVSELSDWFETELTIGCAQVEGQRLSRKEVLLVLERGPVLRNIPQEDQKLVVNHRRALELLARLSSKSGGIVTERTIAAFHSILLAGIDRRAGEYREGPVRDELPAAPSDPSKVRVSMSALSGWLRRTEPSLETAVEAHHRLMAIRPFDKGNCAIALLLLNLILNRAGYPPVAVREDETKAYRESVERGLVLGEKGAFRELILSLLNQSLEFCLCAADRASSAAGEPAADGR